MATTTKTAAWAKDIASIIKYASEEEDRFINLDETNRIVGMLPNDARSLLMEFHKQLKYEGKDEKTLGKLKDLRLAKLIEMDFAATMEREYRENDSDRPRQIIYKLAISGEMVCNVIVEQVKKPVINLFRA